MKIFRVYCKFFNHFFLAGCLRAGLEKQPRQRLRGIKRRFRSRRAAFIEEVSPYRYKFVRYGVMENEMCPILVGFTDELPTPNPEEVEAVRWTPWQVLADITAHPGQYSEWCEEEAHILAKHPRFAELYSLETR